MMAASGHGRRHALHGGPEQLGPRERPVMGGAQPIEHRAQNRRVLLARAGVILGPPRLLLATGVILG